MNLQGLNSILIKITYLFCLIFFLSCSNNDIVKVTYKINEFGNNELDVTFIIYNTSSINIDSPWSLHWNQQSSIVDESSLPDNVKYDYVAGQSYNILNFEKNYIISG